MIRQFFTAMLAALALSTSWVAAAATDVNQASVAELEAIKGIGPVLSAKISSARQQAAFKDWADLVDRVSGLGASHARRFSEAGLTVAGKAYVPPAGAVATAGSKAAESVAARDKKTEKGEKSAAHAKNEKKGDKKAEQRDRAEQGAQAAKSPAAATQAPARDKAVRSASPS